MPDEGEKRLVIEGLGEKGKRAAFQRSGPNRRYLPAGHHDYFRVGRDHLQQRLHFQTALDRHPHVEYSQTHRMALGVGEKTLSVFEALRLQAIRIE